MIAQVFWDAIGNYNEHTVPLQAIMLAFAATAITLSYAGKVKWLAKLALGVLNLFIGVVFFAVYGTEPIQMYFALPLFLLSGALLAYDGIHDREDCLKKPDRFAAVLLAMYLLYPIVSLLLGNSFPKMVTHIMPCPAACLSIAVYSCYCRKKLLILSLLTIWGLTGIKSVFFSAYEDIILLISGIYGVKLIYSEIQQRKAAS